MASSGAVRWVASDVDGLPLKRKQVAQACPICRKRKKRCIHGGDAHDEGRPAVGPPGADPPTRAGSALSDEDDATQVAANHLVELSSSRFVGDLNPEGFFMQAASPTLPATRSSYRDSNDLGVWVPPGELPEDKAPPPVTTTHKGSPRTPHGRHTAARATRLAAAAAEYERAQRNYLKECLLVLPPPADYAVLHAIYCSKVHPLFPVMDESDLVLEGVGGGVGRGSSSTTGPGPGTGAGPGTGTGSGSGSGSGGTGTTSTYAAVVRQIIALAAAQVDMDAAASHLRLEEGGPLLAAREFHSRLAAATATVLEADAIANRFALSRMMLLLSFFYQPSHAGDRNRPAMLCNSAVHHFQTLGAHLQGYRPQRPADDVERIFCALWALDRFCSVFYARPCMMHAQDLGKDIADCIARQPPCFRLFMSVVVWLDRIIRLYRPRQPFELFDIPVFESMILDAEAERIAAMHIGTIEVLYHTVCVLSCRQPVSAFSDTAHARDRAYLPLSILNPRRSHSTDRIVFVSQTQPVCCFPFVPYAVSLALSVQYKKLRYSRTPIFRTRSLSAFKDIVALLRSMSDVFLSARVNASLGESILQQMASTLAREEDSGQAAGETAAPVDRAVSAAPAPAVPPVAAAAAAAPAASTASAASAPSGPPSALPFLPPLAFAPTAAPPAPAASSAPPVDHDYRALVTLPAAPAAGPYDFSMLDGLGDFDLFGNFAPGFDLSAVDTALERNLDMAIPQLWPDDGSVPGAGALGI